MLAYRARSRGPWYARHFFFLLIRGELWVQEEVKVTGVGYGWEEIWHTWQWPFTMWKYSSPLTTVHQKWQPCRCYSPGESLNTHLTSPLFIEVLADPKWRCPQTCRTHGISNLFNILLQEDNVREVWGADPKVQSPLHFCLPIRLSSLYSEAGLACSPCNII